MKNYENFEIDDLNEQKAEKVREFHFLAKIVIILALIIVFQIIYLFFVYSTINEKNAEITNINYQKFILSDGNKKLDRALRDDYNKDYAYDEEAIRKDNEIKSKEKLIKDFKKKSHKLQKKLNNSQSLEEIEEINNKKKEKLGEVKVNLEGKIKAFREQFNTKIFDSSEEVEIMKNTIKNNMDKDINNEVNLDLCFSAYNVNETEFDFKEASYQINFNEHKDYLVLFETNMYERYGIHLNKNENDDHYFIVDLNTIEHKNLFDTKWLKSNEKQNLKLIFNLVKEIKFDNKNNELDHTKYSFIKELEIYKLH